MRASYDGESADKGRGAAYRFNPPVIKDQFTGKLVVRNHLWNSRCGGRLMVDPVEIAADVVTGATALAGLVLVYLGSVAAGYAGYEIEQQRTIRSRFQARAWFAFVGMVLAIIAAMLAIVGKWTHDTCVASAAIALLLLALLWGIAIALLTVREIK
jgi:hypothetical protein